MLQVSGVSLQFGSRKLFEDVNIKFTKGNCYGIIGANGAGKSTFLKILSGELDTQKGEVILDKNERMSVLKQDQNAYNDETVLRTVMLGHKRLVEVMDEKDALYAKEDFTDEDGIKAGELETEFAELGGWYVVDIENGVYSLIPSFSNGFNIEAPVFCNFDFSYITANLSTFLVVMFTFLYTDIFDTVGTLIGVAEKGNLLNEKGELPNATGALMADAVGTCVGAALGVSTVTSYVESSAGVSAGGRTGLASVVTALLFLVSIVFSPIFLAIPSFATAPAMMFVGLLMLGSIKNVDFDSDIADTLGAFAAIVFMPLTYSIANGIMFGMLTWVILKVITGKVKDVKPVMWVTTALFAIYFVLKFMGIM